MKTCSRRLKFCISLNGSVLLKNIITINASLTHSMAYKLSFSQMCLKLKNDIVNV